MSADRRKSSVLLYNALCLVTIMCTAQSSREVLRGNETLFMGNDSWLDAFNAILAGDGLRPLYWSDGITQRLAQVVRNNSANGAPCTGLGFDQVFGKPTLGFSGASPFWHETALPALFMFAYLPSRLVNNLATGMLGGYGWSTTDVKQLLYTVLTTDPVEIGCIVQACNVNITISHCAVNISIAAADNFQIPQKLPNKPAAGGCAASTAISGEFSGIATKVQPGSQPSANTTIVDKPNFDLAAAAARKNVTAAEVACWSNMYHLRATLPAVAGVPCPGVAPKTCQAWTWYTGNTTDAAPYNYTLLPGQDLSGVIRMLGLQRFDQAPCKLCCLNKLQGPHKDCRAPLALYTVLKVSVAAIASNNTADFGECGCLTELAGRFVRNPDSSATPSTPGGPTSQSATEQSSSTSLSGGAIAGIVIGAIAAALLLVVSAAFVIRRRRLHHAGSKTHGDLEAVSDDSKLTHFSKFSHSVSAARCHDAGYTTVVVDSPFDTISHLMARTSNEGSQLTRYKPQSTAMVSDKSGTSGGLHRAASTGQGDILLDGNCLELDKDDEGKPIILGRGGYGVVCAGTYIGQIRVAVKYLGTSTASNTDDMLSRFQAITSEVKILRKCDHPNLVGCVGLIATSWPFKLLSELCEGGDLLKAIAGPNKKQWQWSNKGKQVALDICNGLMYLHNKLRLAHCDVKSSNVLLTGDGRAKVADFGLTRALGGDDEVQRITQLPCSPGYAAPEQLVHQEVSFAVDVFSLGVVMMELLLLHPAPANRHYPTLKPSSTRPAIIVELVQRCMQEDSAQRPKLSEVHEVLQQHVGTDADRQ